MRCYNCGGYYRETTDLVEIADSYVGTIPVEGVTCLICNDCGGILFSEEFVDKLELVRRKRIQEGIKSYPLKDFVTTIETAAMLGITKQALHKHKRISKGFIYHTKIGNIIVYLKPSVERFVKTGDGRFPLYKETVTQKKIEDTQLTPAVSQVRDKARKK